MYKIFFINYKRYFFFNHSVFIFNVTRSWTFENVSVPKKNTLKNISDDTSLCAIVGGHNLSGTQLALVTTSLYNNNKVNVTRIYRAHVKSASGRQAMLYVCRAQPASGLFTERFVSASQRALSNATGVRCVAVTVLNAVMRSVCKQW